MSCVTMHFTVYEAVLLDILYKDVLLGILYEAVLLLAYIMRLRC